ncbi:hypothetical protein Dimus_000995 [Dionaea muscipula]
MPFDVEEADDDEELADDEEADEQADDGDLLPDDWEDLVPEDVDRNIEEERHEVGPTSIETRKETDCVDWRLVKAIEKMWSYVQQKASVNKESPTAVDMFTETRKRVAS